MRKAIKRFLLRKPKIRQSWNKYNLSNMMMPGEPWRIKWGYGTLFQQKWAAKAATRAYHGEHVREKVWVRSFERRLRSVVEMPAEYLASHDGSEQATGRGSGRRRAAIRSVADAAAEGDMVDGNEEVSAQGYLARIARRQGMAEVWRRSKEGKDKEDVEKAGEEEADGDGGREPVERHRLMRKPFNGIQRPWREHSEKMTPYMQMMYAPLERRLEIAMHRALFASSPRQARQFCIHGAVKVNGKKMKYGSYLLNPGDLFEVDPEKVMYAAGKDKNTVEFEARARINAEVSKLRNKALEAGTAYDEEAARAEAVALVQDEAPESAADGDGSLESLPEEERAKRQRKRVAALARSAKNLLASDRDMLNAHRKQELRGFVQRCRAVVGNKDKLLAPDELMDELAASLSKYKLDETSSAVVAKDPHEGGKEATTTTNTDTKDATTTPSTTGSEGETLPSWALPSAAAVEADAKADELEAAAAELTAEERRNLSAMMRQLESDDDADDNPVDPTKPYATPWEPRTYLRPFAFIPRYLEVNQNVCAAVYLRHPVARRGLAEVPTPFPYDVSQLAYAWYLRKR